MKRRVIYDEHPNMEKVLKSFEEKGYEFSAEQKIAINYGICIGVDVIAFSDPRYSAVHLSEIFKTQSQGLDVTPLLNPELKGDRARELRLGLEADLDVSYLMDISMPLVKVQWIRRAMAKGIDVKKYDEFRGNIGEIIAKYNELCTAFVNEKTNTCTLRVVKIQKDINDMVVKYDNKEDLEEAIREINTAHFDRVQRIKDKFYEKKVVIPERKVMEVLERKVYFEVTEKK